MGGPQAAMTLSTVRRAQIERAGEQWSAEEQEEFEKPIREMFDEKSTCWYSTARLWDDGVIDPADTRRTLAMALDICAQGESTPTGFGIFRM